MTDLHSHYRDPMTWMYPALEPFQSGYLKVSELHEIYFEQCGNPNGKPVLVVHGGPGAGCGPSDRRYFDPKHYRMILVDQRGCGRSKPFASLEQNGTWDLVEDFEKVRKHLGIDRWMVFGGSWGSTLGLAYAETHPERVTEMVLRGIFLLRKKEIDWFYQQGAEAIYPDAWEGYRDAIPAAERADFIQAYYKRLTSADEGVRLAAAKAWTTWEFSTSRLIYDPTSMKGVTDEFSLAFARIECHYFVNKAFFEHDDQLLRNVGKIRNIPTVIVQGRYDIVCPMMSAWDLHRAWPEAEFILVPDGGHSSREPQVARALIAANDRFARV